MLIVSPIAVYSSRRSRAHVARHDRAAVDPDAHLEPELVALLVQPLVERGQAHLEHPARGRDRPVGVVPCGERRAEHGHHPVAQCR